MGTFTPHRGTHRFISNDTPISWASSPHRGTKCSISVSERNDRPISWAHPTHGLSHRPTHSVCVLEDVSRSCNHQHFQSCMNHVFNKQLRKFLLVFFDDLLIYSKTWEEHLQHVEQILAIMEDQYLYAKESKCEFGMKEVLYLGHIIGVKGVQVHQEKIQAILDWPTPKTLTELKGFLGICCYYRRFVKGFSQLCAPLTDLTRRGAFKWSPEAQLTFDKMKKVMSTCPVLALPDFAQPFIVECDASGEGIGAVLMQNRHPIVYEIRKLRGLELLYTIYEKYMLAFMHALAKFRQYLVGAKFVARTNRNSLKYFLDQKDLNERQQKWVRKIQADALSKRPSIYAMTDISVD
jgi:hypothetical protein